MAAASEVLELARRELGTREEPYGSNRVKYNTDYYGREVSGGAYPWCCVFLWWLFREAGAPELFYGGGKTASCGTLASYARRNGMFVSGNYRPGCYDGLRGGQRRRGWRRPVTCWPWPGGTWRGQRTRRGPTG